MTGVTLHVDAVGCTLGGLRVLDDVSTEVQTGGRIGIIGPNGAGKSTLFNVITGYIRNREGRIVLNGNDVTGHRLDQIARAGMVRTFQTTRVLSGWSVFDQVHLASEQGGSNRSEIERTRSAISAVALDAVSGHLTNTLNSAQRRRLAIAACLVREPSVILLDEPTAGLDESETKDVAELLVKLQGEYGFAVVLIEHKLSFLMNFCEDVLVLDAGKVIARGAPNDIVANPVVIEAYLGSTEVKNAGT